MNTESTTKKSRSLRAVLAGFVVLASLSVALVSPAGAATGRWYGIPSSQGAQASAIMTWFSKNGGTNNSAGGQIYLHNVTGASKVYVQFKPNEGGTWNRATPNRTSGAAYYNWSNNFTFNYSGFQFRICKDNAIVSDTCGTAMKIYG